MMITPNFSLEELTTTSQRGIDNTPDEKALANLRITALGMERVRSSLDGNPVHINSAYRSPILNEKIGGSKTSAHCHGWAVDFICPALGSPQKVAKRIIERNIRFDQLIYEGSWVHISFDPRMRGEILTAHFGPGPTTYTRGID